MDKKAPTKRDEKRRKWWQQQQEKNNENAPKTTKTKPSSKETDNVTDNNTKTQTADTVTTASPTVTPSLPTKTTSQKGKPSGGPGHGRRKAKRQLYVVFVGNLPFDVTKEQIETHFRRTGEMKDVRLLTNKVTGESRGCAYVEFFEAMAHKRALRLNLSELNGRKINVEFTSAGRKTEKRVKRLQHKNKHCAKFRMAPEEFQSKMLMHKKPGPGKGKKVSQT